MIHDAKINRKYGIWESCNTFTRKLNCKGIVSNYKKNYFDKTSEKCNIEFFF